MYTDELKAFSVLDDYLYGHQINNDNEAPEISWAMETLHKLVLKSVPKKTRTKDKNFAPLVAYAGRCPCCDKINDDSVKFCWNCGQAIDWSEENG